MFSRIENLSPKKLVGKCLTMSFINDQTPILWRSFMPRRQEIQNIVSNDLYSMQIYGETLDYFNINPSKEFTKWAVIEVNNFENIPDGMQSYELSGGLYAVFIHKGTASEFAKTFKYIFGEWLPDSEYEVDNREHFEIINEGYSPTDPNSEEEVWIPIKPKA